MEVAVSTNLHLSQQAQDDYTWVGRAVDGDQKAYAVLMDRYRHSIHKLVLRMVHNQEDAEDLTLEAFGKAFRNLSNYSPTYAFSTWLFRIAVNNCIDHIRKKRGAFFSLDDMGSDDSPSSTFSELLPCQSRNPEERFMYQQQLQIIRQVITQLSERYRLMIELRYFEEMSYEEIASALDIPLGTVKAQLFRAKELLFDLLRKPGASAYFDSIRRRK